MARRINLLSFVIGADTSRMQRDLRRGEQAADNFRIGVQSSLSRLVTSSRIAFATLTGVGGFGGINFLREARDVDVYARSVGITNREFFALTKLVRRVNLDIQDAQDVIKTLNERIADATLGTATYAEAFQRLGLSIDDLRNQGPLENFIQVFGAAAERDAGQFGNILSQFDIEELTGSNTSFILSEFRRLGEDGVRAFFEGFTSRQLPFDERVTNLVRRLQERLGEITLDLQSRFIAQIDLDDAERQINFFTNLLAGTTVALFQFGDELLAAGVALQSFSILQGLASSVGGLSFSFKSLLAVSLSLGTQFAIVAGLFATTVQILRGENPLLVFDGVKDLVIAVLKEVIPQGFYDGIKESFEIIKNFLADFERSIPFIPGVDIATSIFNSLISANTEAAKVIESGGKLVAGSLEDIKNRIENSEDVGEAVDKIKQGSDQYIDVFADLIQDIKEFSSNVLGQAQLDTPQPEPAEPRQQREIDPRSLAGFVDRTSEFRSPLQDLNRFGLSPNEPGRFGGNTDFLTDEQFDRRQLSNIAEDAFSDFSSSLRYAFTTGDYENIGQALFQGIQNALIGRLLDDVSEIVGEFFKDTFSSLGSGNLVKDLGSLLGDLFSGAFGFLKGILGSVGSGLALFHEGGIVPGPPGADVPIIAQAGERIIPVDDVESSFSPSQQNEINLNFVALPQDQFSAMLYREFPRLADALTTELYNRGILQTQN